MLRAWYGITPTGAQADYALIKLAELCSEEFPIAKECLEKDRYADEYSVFLYMYSMMHKYPIYIYTYIPEPDTQL